MAPKLTRWKPDNEKTLTKPCTVVQGLYSFFSLKDAGAVKLTLGCGSLVPGKGRRLEMPGWGMGSLGVCMGAALGSCKIQITRLNTNNSAKHNNKKLCDLLRLFLLGKAFFAEFWVAFCCTRQIRPHVGTGEGQWDWGFSRKRREKGQEYGRGVR